VTSTNSTEGFRIGEMTALVGVSVDTLRFYERCGLIPGVVRRPNGHRCYDERDVAWVRMLTALRSAGMSISTLQRFVRLSQQGDDTLAARCDLLAGHREVLRARIAELEGHLKLLDDKLAIYRGV
jgi:DNA-binding transcriptional MerR regulator